MLDTYLNNQNISNNIIIPNSFDSNKKKKLIPISEKSISYSSSVDDKNETIDNQINDSNSSFDFQDKEIPNKTEIKKEEKTENFFDKSKNFLDYISKAISKNFDFFKTTRKININTKVEITKKKFETKSFNRAISGDKIENKLNKDYNNYISNRIKASKSFNGKKYNKEKNKENNKNKAVIKLIKKDYGEKENIRDNYGKNSVGKNNNKNQINKICKNISINLNPKNFRNLTNINSHKSIAPKNLSCQNITSKIKNQLEKPKIKNIKDIINPKKIKQENLSLNPRLTCVETSSSTNKNMEIAPRLTVPINFFKENTSTRNISKNNNNNNKQINLDAKLSHKQSKSPKNVIIKKLYPNNINNNGINNNNNLCKVKKINSDQNLFVNNINNINNNNQISYNNLIHNLYTDIPVSFPQERMTVSTYQSNPIINNNIINNNTLYSPRLTNIPNNKNNKINLNISLNSITNNYQNYILSEAPIMPLPQKNILKNYGFLTRAGKDTSGLQKTNQDSFTFFTKINGLNDFHIFGVLDGHGIEGHFVSQFASKFIPYQIMNNPEIIKLKDPELIYNKLISNNYYIITKAYLDCDIYLSKVNFDSKESGSTCNLIINIGTHIICANTGDSRSLLIYGENSFIPLSVDFKPEMPEEMNRIILSGGEVRQMKNELGEGVGPYRVWKRGEGYPGLAMSRSIGDLNGKKIGVIPNPGIVEYNIDSRTKFIVVCSDGVWEFLENENVKDIGMKYYRENNPKGFCTELVNTSLHLWESNDIVIDDITAVVAFF